MENLQWRFHGTLRNLDTNDEAGVYIFVYKGTSKRIIYVGTTNCFARRLHQHSEGMRNGERPVWKVEPHEDIYELMSFKGESSEKGKYEYYFKLAKRGLLWATTSLDTSVNDLVKEDSFEEDWKSFVEESYMDLIEIWTCKIDDEVRRVVLESQIQRAFKSNYFIGSHIHKQGMCWLGKIECLEDIFIYKFNFMNLPDISPDSQLLLQNLSERKVINYKKDIIEKRKDAQRKYIEECRKDYKFAFTSWSMKEDELLYNCLRLNISINDIAEKYLFRTIGEIEKREIYLRKWYRYD